MKRNLFIFILLALSVSALSAEEVTTDYSSGLVLQISTLPEAKLIFNQNLKIPFLQGESPLTKDNNINLVFSQEITPISMNSVVSAVLTPIAFLEFEAGGRVGSGWNLKLGKSELYGIGVSRADATGKEEVIGKAFDGVTVKAHLGGTFQFDLAAVVPGEWNHIVVQTYHEINYFGYTHAKENDSWYFESDFGENVNGGNYYASYVIGYQMPIFLNMAAFMAESKLSLHDMPYRSAWGDDKTYWIFSNILNFSITKKFSATVITQFRTLRNFTNGEWNDDQYYRNRILNTSDPYSLKFYRVAAMLNYKLIK